MGRPKAFSDVTFIKALPTNQGEAISCQEIAEKVGCSRALANQWLNKQLKSGLINVGKPYSNGVLTYYAVSSRPDNWLPGFTDLKGVRRPISWWIKSLINAESSGPISRPVFLAILNTWINACSDEVKFSEANQLERTQIQNYREQLKSLMDIIDSFLNEPFLSGNNEEVSMAQDAIRAVSGDIELQEVIDKYNALRQL